MSSVTVDRFFGHFVPSPIKSKSCPNFIHRTDSLVQEAVQELIKEGQVGFECRDAQPTFHGRIIQPARVKQLAKEKGYSVFQSEILIMNDDTIPPGTRFLLLTTQPPVPPFFK